MEVFEEKVVRLEVLVKVRAPAPAELTPAAPAELIQQEIPIPIPTEPVEPTRSSTSARTARTTTTTGLADPDALRFEKFRQGPVGFRARGTGCGARAPGECGGMGRAGAGCREYGGAVRCWVGGACSLVETAGKDSGGDEWGRCEGWWWVLSSWWGWEWDR